MIEQHRGQDISFSVYLTDQLVRAPPCITPLCCTNDSTWKMKFIFWKKLNLVWKIFRQRKLNCTPYICACVICHHYRATNGKYFHSLISNKIFTTVNNSDSGSSLYCSVRTVQYFILEKTWIPNIDILIILRRSQLRFIYILHKRVVL